MMTHYFRRSQTKNPLPALGRPARGAHRLAPEFVPPGTLLALLPPIRFPAVPYCPESRLLFRPSPPFLAREDFLASARKSTSLRNFPKGARPSRQAHSEGC